MKDMAEMERWSSGPVLVRVLAPDAAFSSTCQLESNAAMVSAESLNFDVLQIIFSYLSPPDLASVSQVCQSFLAGALPRLYRSLGFYHNQAKRYPRVCYPSLSLENSRPW